MVVKCKIASSCISNLTSTITELFAMVHKGCFNKDGPHTLSNSSFNTISILRVATIVQYTTVLQLSSYTVSTLHYFDIVGLPGFFFHILLHFSWLVIRAINLYATSLATEVTIGPSFLYYSISCGRASISW